MGARRRSLSSAQATRSLRRRRVQGIGDTRPSNAYCSKSDGTVVLVGNNVLRRERAGLLIEPSSVNLVGASGADARNLAAAGWTKTNMTCTKTATGADSVANAASTCTATSTNGTVTYAITVASTKRFDLDVPQAPHGHGRRTGDARQLQRGH
jgi:hypothetical protein